MWEITTTRRLEAKIPNECLIDTLLNSFFKKRLLC